MNGALADGRARAAGTRYVMGTLLTVRVESVERVVAARIRDEIFGEVQRLEDLLSLHRPGSDIARINRAAGRLALAAHPDAYAAVAEALRFAELTGGAFDPTMGAWKDVRLDAAGGTVFLPRPGLKIDLGGIGKGFALDRALGLARRSGALGKLAMDFGGQLLFWAPAGTFEPVKIAIENPRERGAALSVFELRENGSVSTSSQAERPGHLIDPRSGRAAGGVASVTVVAPTATEAEAWSTALFVDPGAASRLKGRAGVKARVFA